MRSQQQLRRAKKMSRPVFVTVPDDLRFKTVRYDYQGELARLMAGETLLTRDWNQQRIANAFSRTLRKRGYKVHVHRLAPPEEGIIFWAEKIDAPPVVLAGRRYVLPPDVRPPPPSERD
jgi:hypothetical protein